MKYKITTCPWSQHDAIAYLIDGITSIYCPTCPGSVGDRQYEELRKIFTLATTKGHRMPQESFSSESGLTTLFFDKSCNKTVRKQI